MGEPSLNWAGTHAGSCRDRARALPQWPKVAAICRPRQHLQVGFIEEEGSGGEEAEEEEEAFHAFNLGLRATAWFEYVRSEANIADMPSRGEFEYLHSRARSQELPLT